MPEPWASRLIVEGGGVLFLDEMPEFKAKKGMSLVDALAESKIVASKSEARRLIEQGGVKVNDKPVSTIDATAEKGIVKVGKRKFMRITLR